MKTRVPEKQERVGSNEARKEYATQSFHCKYQKVKEQLGFTETPNQDFALGTIELQLHPITPEITYTSPSFAYVCVYDMYMHAHMSVDTHECICMWKSKTDIRVFLNHFLPYSLGQGLSMNPELVSTGYLACFKDISTGSPSPSEPCNSRRITIPVQCLHEF